MNRKDLNEGLYRVYTVDVLECLRHYNKHREILFLYADKDSLSFEKFDISEAVAHKLQFQIKRREDGDTEGQCAMLAERPPEGQNDVPWLVFKDKAGKGVESRDLDFYDLTAIKKVDNTFLDLAYFRKNWAIFFGQNQRVSLMAFCSYF